MFGRSASDDKSPIVAFLAAVEALDAANIALTSNIRVIMEGEEEAGSPNLVAMAPGVSGALITTVVALCVAIPAMFGYNFLVTSIRGIIVEMDNFAAELASEFEHKYVDHGARESTFRR